MPARPPVALEGLIEDHDWKYLEITRHDVFRAGRRHLMLSRLARLLGQ